MKSYLRIQLLFCTLVILFLSACAAPRKDYNDGYDFRSFLWSKYVLLYYTGNPQPIEEVSVVSYTTSLILHGVEDGKGEPIKPFRVESQKGQMTAGPSQLHFAPGTYTFTFGYRVSENNFTSWSKQNISKTLTLKAGDVQHFIFDYGRQSWSLSVKDGSSALPELKRDFLEIVKAKS